MAKNSNAPSPEGATSEEVVETPVVEQTPVVEAKAAPANAAFEVNGRKYVLSDRCPATLKFNGVVYTKKELLTDNDVLQSLVIGQSPFVKKA